MRTIVAGSRHVTDYELVKRELDRRKSSITMLRHGACRGVDTLAKRWAEENGIAVESSPAEWEKHGIRAGLIRNAWMACHADQLIAFWDGVSRGTGHVIRMAQQKKILITIIPVSGEARTGPTAHPQHRRGESTAVGNERPAKQARRKEGSRTVLN